MTGKYCCQFSLLTCNWFIGQFVRPVVEEGMGWKGNRYLARCVFNFIREHEDQIKNYERQIYLLKNKMM